MIPVDTVPAGYTREDVGSIPTPGHLQIDVTPLMVRGYVRRGRRRGRKSFAGNDLRQFFKANTMPKKSTNKLKLSLDIADLYCILRE